MRRSTATVAATVLAAVVSLTSCARNDYYRQDPYPNGQIDRKLARAEAGLAAALQTGRLTTIALEYTARPFAPRMARFVTAYAGHPTTTSERLVGDDATAQQQLTITCASGQEQRVSLTWGWFDGHWRAFPDIEHRRC